MLLLRAKIEGKDSEGKITLESIPSKIKSLIQKNPDLFFEFVIGELEDDPKKAKKAKYKNQRKVHTKELKGKSFTLQLKGGDVTVKVDKDGHPRIETNENYLVAFSDFLNEAKNIKNTELFGNAVKIYCLGKDIEVHCKNRKDAEDVARKLRKHYEHASLSTINEDDLVVKVALLPGDILKLFLEKHG